MVHSQLLSEVAAIGRFSEMEAICLSCFTAESIAGLLFPAVRPMRRPVFGTSVSPLSPWGPRLGAAGNLMLFAAFPVAPPFWGVAGTPVLCCYLGAVLGGFNS